MTKRDKPAHEALPANLNKRMEPPKPAWDHARFPNGTFPMPDNLEEFDPEKYQEWAREIDAYYAQYDKMVAEEQERLLPLLLKFLGVDDGDYKSGFIRLAERYVPAFNVAEKRGREPNFHDKLKLLGAVERKMIEENLTSYTDALLAVYPELKKAKSQKELRNKQNRLAEARRLFRPPPRRAAT